MPVVQRGASLYAEAANSNDQSDKAGDNNPLAGVPEEEVEDAAEGGEKNKPLARNDEDYWNNLKEQVDDAFGDRPENDSQNSLMEVEGDGNTGTTTAGEGDKQDEHDEKGEGSSAVVPTIHHQESQRADNHDLDDDDDDDADDDDDDEYDDEFEDNKLRSMTKAALEQKMMSLTEKLEELKESKKINGKAVLKMINNKAKEMTDDDEKKKKMEIIGYILGTYNKYNDLFKSMLDDSMFLEVAQVFNAEYDSRRTIPAEIEEVEAMIYKTQDALDYKMEERKRTDTLRLQARMKHKKDLIQKNARQIKKRNVKEFEEEYLALNSNKKPRGIPKGNGKSPMRSPWRM